MAIIEGGTTAALQEVGSTSKGAYVELRDTAGNPLSHSQREYVSNSLQEGILMAGKNDEAILTIEGEVGEYMDTQQVIIDGTNMVINGWIYNEQGIFVGNE